MASTRVELPDGHLVNLSPRPTRQSPYKAYRVDYKTSPTELSAITPPRYAARSAEHVTPTSVSSSSYQTSKNTKLPVPKSLADTQSHERRQTPSPTGLPKPTTPSHLGQRAQPGSSGGQRDQYLKKLRDRFEKDSPLSEKSSRGQDSDTEQSPNPRFSYHRSRPQAGNRSKKPTSRGTTAPSGIPSPSTANSSPAQGLRSNAATSQPVDSKNKWRKQGDQWINMDVPDTTPQKSDKAETVNSSPRSQDSVSPVSAEDSSITDCDWEDRFVVNMPSAKDPNPPTMTAQQIAEYQKSIERVRQTGGRMVHPDSLPSRNASPESKSSIRGLREQTPQEFKAYDGTYEGQQMPRSPRDESLQSSPQQQNQQQNQQQPKQQPQPQPQPLPATGSLRPPANHYYSPDEIGHTRISTIWEESPTKTKEKRHPQNADGSFLGCREISGEKNPDEILMFTPLDDASLHPRPLALASKNIHRELKDLKKGTARKTAQIVEETTVLREERPQISQSSKPALCLKSSTPSHDQPCPPNPSTIPRKGSQDSGKENSHPVSSPPERSGSVDSAHCDDDDVFIITPTITRTMIPTSDKKQYAPKPQGLRRAGGASQAITAEATKAIRAKAQMISTPSGLRPGGSNSQLKPTGSSLAASQTFPSSTLSSTGNEQGPVDRGQDRTQEPISDKAADTASSSIRGFIRTSGLARSSGLAAILRNGTESLRNRAESLRNGSGSLPRTSRKVSTSSQSTIPTRDNSESSRSERSFQSLQSFQSAKETPIASEEVPKSPPKSLTVEDEPKEQKSAHKKWTASNKPVAKKVTMLEDPSSKAQPDKPPTSTRRISALAKLSKGDKTSNPSKPSVVEKSSAPKTKKVDVAPKKDVKEQRSKPLPRLHTSGKVTEIAELDSLQVASPKESLQSNITDVHADLGDIHNRDTDDSSSSILNPLALSLIFNILVIAITQVNRILRMGTDSYYTKFVVDNTLSMTEHCYYVFSCIYTATCDYQATGVWPKARNDKAISRFMVELLQAVVYLFILGFAAMLIGRVAGYVVLVSSWIVWFARPFAWVFQCVGRALIMN
ncbi:unnamed protein product [Penicillium bialowiezense]